MNEIGQSRSRVLVIDDFMTNAQGVVGAAAALAPFPKEVSTAYPGQRRQIGPTDEASAYVVAALKALAPVIQRGFGALTFNIVEASFSLVTTPPHALRGNQRVPHIDCDDQSILAIIHHLHHLPVTGTSFYRHKASGLERADPKLQVGLRSLLNAEAEKLDALPGGFADGNGDAFEQIFDVASRFNRLVIYQGCVLHSGRIPPEFAYSDDPRKGRLTANIFVKMTGPQYQ